MDWETYPACLPTQAYDPYLFDVEADREFFKSDSNRLFVSDNKTAVQVIQMGSKLGEDHYIQLWFWD